MDDLKRDVDRGPSVEDATRQLAELLSRADLDQLREAAEDNDLEAIARLLELEVSQRDRLPSLEALARSSASIYAPE